MSAAHVSYAMILQTLLIIALLCISTSNAFYLQKGLLNNRRHSQIQIQEGFIGRYAYSKKEEEQQDASSSYDTSEASSKGIVSTLTGVVNFFMGKDDKRDSDVESSNEGEIIDPSELCSTPNELSEKIKDDYVVNNYLWTGDIYLPAFEKNCQFTDPTLSFVGRDKFVNNVQNLRPIVEFLTKEDDICKSDLLDIQINTEEQYVESRWNMYGQLSVLPWKPCIDVIGRTKFWYRDSVKSRDENNDESENKSDKSVSSGLRVYYYDEKWEMPAGRALLQLVTPGGTITSQK